MFSLMYTPNATGEISNPLSKALSLFPNGIQLCTQILSKALFLKFLMFLVNLQLLSEHFSSVSSSINEYSPYFNILNQ